jgi:hypothetical protein
MRFQQASSSCALCVEDGGMEDLEARKALSRPPNREAAREGHIRVVDESGEDYIYPSDLFVPVRLARGCGPTSERPRSVQVSGCPRDDSAGQVSRSGPNLRRLRGPLNLTPGLRRFSP